ncbi:uncharacterized protein DNG_10107 [Cephalotrichum gorgonifer]|uniref:Uncharacterized protein n=1 Tax=Cephalotrichum gorgonifer TaxID=2041049 RepID=A0AAE8N8I7_9PEZI|nr:uncharacterized protein DNG_10107 [Cephalotrichum gorgonifer]
MEWAKATYNSQYEKWVPWLEDIYLRWFTTDNKASYTAKQTLDKTKVTGVEQVDTLQDGLHNLASGQVGQGGLLEPVGDFASKEGATRSERWGKDEQGNYIPATSAGNGLVSGVVEGGKSVVGGAVSGTKGAGGFLGNAL